jgi:hypothetical protein
MSEPTQFAPPHHLKGRLEEGGGSAAVSYGPENGLIASFYEEPVYMEYLSKTCGHPIFQTRIFTRLLAPGNNKTVWVHETKGVKYEMALDPESGEYHTDWEVLEVCENGDVPEPTLFPKAWRAFERKGIQADSGWPVEEWGVITRSYAQSLKAMNVHTVESLAQLTDQAAQGIMGAIKYRDLARAALDDRKRSAIVSREQEKAARAEERNKELEARVEQLIAIVEKQQAQLSQMQMGAISIPAGARTSGDFAAASAGALVKSKTRKQSQRQHAVPQSESKIEAGANEAA